MRRRIVLSAVALALLVPRPNAQAGEVGPWGLARGEWFPNVEGSTFTANTFHLAGGDRVETGSILEERRLRLYGEAGWKKHLTFVFALPAVSVTRRDPVVTVAPALGPTPLNQYKQATATGFQDVLLGVRWNLANGPSALAVELDWSAPAGYNRNLGQLGQTLGDGLQQLSLELGAGRTIMGRGFLQGSLGYGYRYLGIGKRDQGPVVDAGIAKYTWSDRLLASADLGVWVGPSLLAGGRYRGTVTVANGVLVPETDRHLAGALLLYRVDDRLDVFAGSWSTASGSNTPHFDQVYLGLAFRRAKLDRLQGFLGGTPTP